MTSLLSANLPQMDHQEMDDNMELGSDFDPRNPIAEGADGDIDFMRDASVEPDRDIMIDDNAGFDPATTEVVIEDIIQDDDMLDGELLDESRNPDQDAFFQGKDHSHNLAEDHDIHFDDEPDVPNYAAVPEMLLGDDLVDPKDVDGTQNGIENTVNYIIATDNAEEPPQGLQQDPEHSNSQIGQATVLHEQPQTKMQAPNAERTTQLKKTDDHAGSFEEFEMPAEQQGAMLKHSEPENAEAVPEIQSKEQEAEYDIDGPHIANLHPVRVIYDDSDLCLFPPSSNDESETFLLQDESLAFESVDKLLTACREVLAGDVDESDELFLDVDLLDLHYSEHSSHASHITFAQIVDVYLALNHNDGNDVTEPLYVGLRTKLSCTSRYDYLVSLAAEGKGISYLSESQSANPPADEMTPQDVEEAHVHQTEPFGARNEQANAGFVSEDVDYTEKEQDSLEPGSFEGNADIRAPHIPDPTAIGNKDNEQVTESNDLKDPRKPTRDENNLFDLDADRERDAEGMTTSRADASSVTWRTSEPSTVEDGDLDFRNGEYELSFDVDLKPTSCSCSECNKTSLSDTIREELPGKEPHSTSSPIANIDDQSHRDQADQGTTQAMRDSFPTPHRKDPDAPEAYDKLNVEEHYEELHQDDAYAAEHDSQDEPQDERQNEPQDAPQDVSQDEPHGIFDLEDSVEYVSEDEGEIVEEDLHDHQIERNGKGGLESDEYEADGQAKGSLYELEALVEGRQLTAAASAKVKSGGNLDTAQGVALSSEYEQEDIDDHRSIAPSSATLGPAADEEIDYSDDEGLIKESEDLGAADGSLAGPIAAIAGSHKRPRAVDEDEDFLAAGLATPPSKRRSADKLQPPSLALDDEAEIDISGIFTPEATRIAPEQVHSKAPLRASEDEVDLSTPKSKARPVQPPQSPKRAMDDDEIFDFADPYSPSAKKTRS